MPETVESAGIDLDPIESIDGEAIEEPPPPRPVERSPWLAMALILVGAAVAIAAISVRRPVVNFASFAMLGLAWMLTRPLTDGEGRSVPHPAVEGSARVLVGVFALLMAALGTMDLLRD